MPDSMCFLFYFILHCLDSHISLEVLAMDFFFPLLKGIRFSSTDLFERDHLGGVPFKHRLFFFSASDVCCARYTCM